MTLTAWLGTYAHHSGFPSRYFLLFVASSWLMTKRIHLEQMCAGDSCRYEDPTHYKATNWNTTPVNQMNSGAGFFVVLGICCGYSFEIAIWLLSCRGGKSFTCTKVLNLHLCRADQSATHETYRRSFHPSYYVTYRSFATIEQCLDVISNLVKGFHIISFWNCPVPLLLSFARLL